MTHSFGWDLPPGCSQADCDGEEPLVVRLCRTLHPELHEDVSDSLILLGEDICHQSAYDGAALEIESDLERDRR